MNYSLQSVGSSDQMTNSSTPLIISPDETPTVMFLLAQRVELVLKSIDILKGWNAELARLKALSIAHVVNASKNIRDIKSQIHEIYLDKSPHQGRIKELLHLKQRILFIANNLPKHYNRAIEDSRTLSVSNVEKTVQPLKPPASSLSTCTVPPVGYLTQEEYEKIPKYLKGRISYEKINSMIDQFNSVLEKKYSILRKKKSSLKKVDADRVVQFKHQQTKETNGLYFCVADDFKSLGGNALDKTALNIMNILRHCGRLREMRSSGILRYVAVY